MAEYTPEWAAPITWLEPDQIRQAARLYAMNTPGCIQWGCTWDQIGRASTTGSHAIALMRAVCGNLDVPGGDGMPGPALNYLTDEEMELNECLPEEQKAKQIGSNKFKLTSWPGYQMLSDLSLIHISTPIGTASRPTTASATSRPTRAAPTTTRRARPTRSAPAKRSSPRSGRT